MYLSAPFMALGLPIATSGSRYGGVVDMGAFVETLTSEGHSLEHNTRMSMCDCPGSTLWVFHTPKFLAKMRVQRSFAKHVKNFIPSKSLSASGHHAELNNEHVYCSCSDSILGWFYRRPKFNAARRMERAWRKHVATHKK